MTSTNGAPRRSARLNCDLSERPRNRSARRAPPRLRSRSRRQASEPGPVRRVPRRTRRFGHATAPAPSGGSDSTSRSMPRRSRCRRGRDCRSLHEAVVAPSAEDCVLRADVPREDLERRAGVVVEPAHQPVRHPVGHAVDAEVALYGVEVRPASLAQVVDRVRQGGRSCRSPGILQSKMRKGLVSARRWQSPHKVVTLKPRAARARSARPAPGSWSTRPSRSPTPPRRDAQLTHQRRCQVETISVLIHGSVMPNTSNIQLWWNWR